MHYILTITATAMVRIFIRYYKITKILDAL